MPEQDKTVEYLRWATAELQKTRAELAAHSEPLAIVGMACRLPGGVASPDDLWRLLESGGDGITPFPTDRGWETSGEGRGGFLTGAAGFDAAFFGISPREALAMDPQQRVVLETSWEAFEHAAIDPRTLRGSDTGVFLGAFFQGYGIGADFDGYGTTSIHTSVLSGRLAYFYGLEGPAVTVDTACSSSLVALHQAGQSLRSGECSLALVGGVTVMASPAGFADFSEQGGLAPDARCKAFAEAADGTGFAEGSGVLIVEKLSDAERLGHRILAVVRGSAVNQDGASNGLSAPNGPSQERVIRQALANAGLTPADVDAVEAHGTGTTLGDPIEAQALLATYGQNRTTPLLLGSLKSNIGHTQAAAGVAGVIKMVLAMRHGTLPPTLHIDQPSTQVDWTTGRIDLLTDTRPWPETERPHRAGVSSFGVSGTNAHVILESHPTPATVPTAAPDTEPPPLLLSARTPQALDAQIQRLRAFFDDNPGADRVAIAQTLARRTQFEHRAVLLGDTLVTTHPNASRGPVVFVYSGQSTLHPHTGRQLADTYSVFADAWRDALGRLDPAQGPATHFAHQAALTALLRSWGITPHAVIGHSLGEITAAHAAGVLSLQDAATLLTTRTRLMDELPAGGAMVTVLTSEEKARQALRPGVEIAAVNGPHSVVLSGDEDAVLEAARQLGIHHRLPTRHAGHSERMQPLVAPLLEAARALTYHQPHTAIPGEPTTAEYWAHQVRAQVRFQDHTEQYPGATFLEIGPNQDLSPLVDGVPAQTGTPDEVRALHTALAQLHVRGAAIDWTLVLGGDRAPVALPTYPFQHKDYWLRATSRADVAGAGQEEVAHPLLGAAVALPGTGGVVLTGRLSLASQPWLGEHAVGGTVLLPGAAFLELVARAGDEVGCDLLHELVIETPLVLHTTGGVAVSVEVAEADDTGRRAVTVHARSDGSAPWTRHATGFLGTATAAVAGTDPAPWPPTGAAPVDVADVYDRFEGLGYAYGPAFQGLRAAWRDGDTVYAEVALPDEQSADAARFTLHPALLDAAFQAGALPALDAPGGAARLPFSFQDVRFHAAGATRLRVTAGRDGERSTVHMTGEDGQPVAVVGSVLSRPFAEGSGDGLLRPVWTELPMPAPSADDPRVEVIGADPVDGDTPAAVRELTARVLGALQHHLSAAEDTTLVVRTGTGPAAAAAAGLVRSAQAENPGRIVLVEAAPDTPVELLAACAALDEPQLAVRDGVLFAPRLVRMSDPSYGPLPLPDGDWLLTRSTSGTLHDVALTADDTPRRALEAGEVRIEVRAAGLNFRDVLIALGTYTGATSLGGEAAGVVVETGPGVADLSPGDRVFGLTRGGIGPTAVTDRRWLARIPEGWSFTTAASVPVVFATAWYGLVDLAGLRAGEKVLVHAATGGVGMAASQIARHLGADLYATASTGKQHVLRAAGLPGTHIADSRTTAFRTAFPRMDVVLNALTGEFIDASLDLLDADGRFVEMGRTELRDPAAIAPAYLPFDLLDAGTDRIGEILGELLRLFEAGALEPLPVRAWDVRQAREALGWMSRARHIGKNVLTLPRPLDPEGAVVITGGSGTLAGILARHLREHHVYLLSRTAPPEGTPGTHLPCDVGDRDQLAAALERIDRPITAVLHLAGALDDGTIASLTPERFDTVLRPKADGAWYLHELTQDQDLAAFVLYSSAAGVLGNAGQGNYVAANAFLDALAELRHASGLPALSIAWGLWEEVSGLTATLGEADRDRMRRSGFRAITAQQGMDLYEAAGRTGTPVAVAAALDDAPDVPLLRGLRRTTVRRAAVRERSLADRLTALTGDERAEALLTLVRESTAAVLGHVGGEEIPATAAFKDLGIDSLTAVQLRNTLTDATGVRLNATAVFDFPTPRLLATKLGDELTGTRAPVVARTAATAGASDEPLAIVGMACRLPGGVASPDELWRLVASGTDAISEFPTDRGWDIDAIYDPDPDAIGKTFVRHGGFLTGATGFDAAFFGISPREALAMDPQQRVLLETSWEAFESAGITPDSARGSDTGVFVGAFSYGYGTGADTNGFGATGSQTSVLSGRLSYFYGLEGPAVTVDTACSSSLVALHQAGQSLRSGECSLALVGGVTVMASPGGFVEFCRQRGLAPDGRAKAFGAGADGTSFAEGAGVLIVEKLSDAERHGHTVLAVVRGSAVNQDGASNGLSAPNGPSQERVIRQALANAGLTPADVDAVEAHGTGTKLGDPIEAQALLATYGQDRTAPLLLGSLKSNIGHAQAASGVAGIIKMVQALQHGELPPTLHADEPSPHVEWTSGAVELLTDARPWPETDRPRRAAVSSFGVSGTNAHVILEAGPAAVTPPAAVTGTPAVPAGDLPLLVSARSPEALDEQIRRLRGYLDATPGADRAAVAQTLARRTHFAHRAVLLGDTVVTVPPAKRPDELVFVYSGQGTQHPAMGEQLAAALPVFADAWHDALGRLGDPDPHDPTHSQHTLFAHQAALTALLRSWGITPHAVIGHSLGEVTAAHTAGILSLDDACALITARARLMHTLPPPGAMVTVLTSEEKARQALRPGVEIAAVNGPHSIVLSGNEDAVLAVAGQLGIHHRLPAPHAGHSSHMEPVAAELLATTRGLGYGRPHTAIPNDPTTAEYWAEQVREPVLFHTHAQQYPDAVFVEIGPAQDLSPLVDGIPLQNGTADEVRALHTALAHLYARGATLDWPLILGGTARHDAAVPTYAFQRRPYWIESAPPATADASHPVLGSGIALAGSPGQVFTGTVPAGADRAVSIAELALAAADAVDCATVERLDITSVPGGPGRGRTTVQTWVDEPADDGRRRFTMHTRTGDAPWTPHAEGLLRPGGAALPEAADTTWPPPGAVPADGLPGAWRRGDQVFVEAEVDGPDGFVVHPDLLDAVFSALGDGSRQPAEWRDLAVHASDATVLRACLTRRADGAMELIAYDGAGLPVLTTEAVTLREVASTGGSEESDGLHRMEWRAVAEAVYDGELPEGHVLISAAHPDDPQDMPGLTHARTTRVLTALQHHLTTTDHTLWVHTTTDPAGAAATGLTRTAQNEHPDRIHLIETQHPHTPLPLHQLATLNHPHLRLTNNTLHTPHLTPLHTTTPTTPGAGLNPDHAIIITGGSGTLAGILARHLNHPHTYLLSRTPPPNTTPGTHLPCDITNPDQLTATLNRIPEPLTAVIHTAATLDDGILDTLTPHRLATVLQPKADAAWHLHHLTQHQPLTHFILYSSAAATLGSPGQANYAAANAFLDALATHRHTHNQPATSIAWGMWHTTSTLTAQLSDADRDRIRRGGFLPITDDEGMRLYEAAVGSGEDFVLAASMDPAQLMTGDVPPLLSGLRRGARRVARAGQTFAQRLAEMPDADRDAALVTLVSDATAAVLGHADASDIAPTTTFKDLGIDSLTAIELRNRLAEATGLRLSATLVFDHPTPRVLAAELRTDLFGTAVPVPAQTARASHDEPLAIVGMACRLPGDVTSPEDLWRLVASGSDAITEFPTDRGWDIDRMFDPDPDAPGKTYVRHGGFLAEAAGFDAAFFGISPREARAMDPQQRVILETSWEAFENAGIVPDTLRGSDTGVFMGAFSHGYGAGVDLGGFGATATQNSVLSGRLSYFFGMEGPAVTVDTACSSSLVALHQAAQALRAGECSLALAGGVTVMPTPLGYVEFCRQRGLAADGRAKAFAEGADGTSFSEGAGVLVLERLSDAERNGHTVLAVVRSSAVNQDGASNGISAPNGPSQQRVIRQALDRAGLTPADVDVVEAHGTGTPLGDPIEAQAVIATYGQDRETPLYLGSVKSNIGHTQTTAGVAGVIKMVMAMRHGVAPKTLHVDEPSSHIDWTAGAVELLTDARPWPDAGRPRRAGVSSLGISGTNAHVILEGVAEPSDTESPEGDVSDAGLVPLPVSARSQASLTAQVERLNSYLGPDTDVATVAHGLVHERAVFDHRTVLVGDAQVAGVAVEGRRTVFVFPGQGAQWAGMGVELMASSPVFAVRMEECAQALLPHTGWDVREMLSASDVADRVEVLQPASWAVAVSLAALWQAHGVTPDAVIGHSQGEIAAACVAGALSLEDAARVVALRSQVIASKLAGRGAMASIALSAADIELVEGVWIAACNGPASTVVAGDPDAVEQILARYEADGVRVRRIAVDYASHTPHVEAIEDELTEALAGVSAGVPSVAWWSTVDSTWVTEPVDEGYWYRNLRSPVALDAAVAELDGSLFVECSAHPVLLPAIDQDHTVASLRTDDGGPERWLTALAQAWTLGAAVDWTTVVEPVPGRLLDLPTYAFEHKRYWLQATPGGGEGIGHPLLTTATALPAHDGTVLTGRISLHTHPWLADHAIQDTVLLPGTAFLELAIRAGDEVGCDTIDELVIEAPLVLPATGAVELTVTVEQPDDSGRRPVTVHARPEGTESWTRHATGTLTITATDTTDMEAFPAWPPTTATPVDVAEFYPRLTALGYRFGPVFRGVRAAWLDGDTVYAEVALPEDRAADVDGFGVHPALLDAALQSGSLLMLESGGEQSVQLPFSWHGVRFHATGATALRVAVVPGPEGLRLRAADSGNRPVATIDALVTRSPEADLAPADPVLRVGWTPVPVPSEAGPSDVDVLTLHSDDADPLAETRDLTTRVLDALHRADRPVIFQVTGGLAAEAAAGLVRTAQSEQPGRFFLVETAPGEVLDGAERDMVAALDEPRLRLRDGVFEAARLMRAAPFLTLPDNGAWQLRPSATGSLDDLAVVPTEDPDRPLAAGEVRIAVRAAGLNFRDVTVALGVVADTRPLGSEAAGVVLETGPGVTDLAPGDRVLGMLAGAFAPVAITDRRLLGRIPEGWTYPQAASVMTAFATAWYGLVDLAQLRPGEKVLIHAAASGVGAAAVQIARHLGAEVYATTSTAKRHLVDLDGTRLADSRSAAFADAFPPVDVVLNSLTGDLLDASVGLLAPDGRFVEMGKTDIRHAIQKPFDLIEAGLDRMQQIIVELLGLFERGALHPLPVRAWDVRRAREAFGWMSSGRHTGKLVLTVPRPLDPEGAVVITGGSGTLAGILARHLNHPHTYLLSRTPPPNTTPGTHLVCDVTDPDQLATALARIPQPLTAVVHTAATLDDALLDNLTPDRIDTVLKPKADAAWHLHHLTRDTDLTAFILYSAVAGLMGSPGQGNYVAANAFLDALAEHRQALGLPGQSLAWGMWEDVSALTAKLTDGDRQRIRRSGFPPLSAADGMRLFDAATRTPEPVVAATTVDVTRIGEPVAPLLRGLVAQRSGPVRSVARNVGDEPLAARLAGRTAAEQRRMMLEVVLRHAAAVLAYGLGDQVAADRPFRELGFDSLTAVDLRNRLAAETGLRLPTTLVFSHPTAEALTAHLLELIDAPGAHRAGRSLPAVPAAPAPAARDRDEPIAIVAMACRLPGGVTSPEDLWQLVESGTDAITTPPDGRGWDVDTLYDPDPDAAGKAYNLRGGFLVGAAEFDAAFFDISPREALGMDPQQRLLLETAWEAIERGRISPASLRGREVGVYVGAAAQGYGLGAEDTEGNAITGSSTSLLSGRLAYVLGLEGPAVTVDTACSSSLVALHLACQGLRLGECELALAGGVSVLSSPAAFVEFSRQRGLAPDGRCKSFGAGADGTTWAEGVGMLVLERLSDAERLGHTVLGVVRGSAVTSDGASNGLTAPNGLSQQRVIRKALASAGLTGADVDVIEGHGTGTRLGDPVEADALLATYGQDRATPVWLGSLKSNIGHATAAAGVAGVIKMVQAIGAGTMPRTLHAQEPSPAVDWTTGRVSLLAANRPWPDDERPRRAAVSAFGLSGTNAHVVLEQHRPDPVAVRPPREESGPLPWVLSARTPDALRAQAARLRDHMAVVPDTDPLDIGYALATSRAHFAHRAAVVAAPGGFRAALDAVADGVEGPGVVTGTAQERRVAFLFDGQGAQRAGMGRDLHRRFPVFAEAWDEVSDAFAKHLEHSPTDVYHGAHGALADDTLYAQAGLFTLEVALLRLLEHWGVRPDVLVGHSVGEVTAAYAAGVLSLADATALITARGQALRALPPGAMTAVDASPAEVGAFTDLDVAAVNGPSAVVLAGSPDDVAAFEGEWTATGRRTKRLDVGHAFHSRHVDGALDGFRTVLESLTFGAARLPVVSTTTGQDATDDLATPGHWLRHARWPVLFADAVRELADRGVTTFVAVGPSGSLASAAADSAGAAAGTYHALMRSRVGEETATLTAVAELHAQGVPVDLAAVLAGGRPVDLPVYAFQHRSYWLAPAMREAPAAVPVAGDPVESEPDDLTVAEIVRRCTAALLGVTDPAEVDGDATFFTLGFDSLAVQRLRNQLSSATGLDLPAAVLFEHDTPAALTTFLEDRLDTEEDDEDDEEPTVLSLLEEMESLDAADIAATPAPERAAIADLLDKLAHTWKDYR